MNQIDKYYESYLGSYAQEGTKQESENTLTLFKIIKALLRRWYIVLLTVVVLCAIGIPAIFYMFKPSYETVGAIRVSPILPNVLFDDAETQDVMPNYQGFMNTQAELMSSNEILNRVAEDMAKRGIRICEPDMDPVAILKLMINKETILIEPGEKTELINIKMKTNNTAFSEELVDSFIRVYMTMQAYEENQGEDNKLALLENKRASTAKQMQQQRKIIRQLAEEFGTTSLTGRQEMMLEQVMKLQNELTTLETKRIALEANVQMKVNGDKVLLAPTDRMKLKYEFINADLTIKALTEDMAKLERDVLGDQQTMVSGNPRLEQRKEILTALKTRLDQRREDIGKKFEELIEEQINRSSEFQVAELKAELAKVRENERRIREKLEGTNAELITLGKRHLAIKDHQEQLELTKELYDAINRKIQKIEMESQRPARVSVAYYASSVIAKDKRQKLAIVAVLGSICCGGFLGVMIDRSDKRMRTPTDLNKSLSTRIIGTTVCPTEVKRSELSERLADDYRTIRANISMLEEENQHILAVTSSQPKDGKTTFSINFAASLAQNDRKVLLIDGDLRKPDIARILNLPEGTTGLSDVLEGKPFANALWYAPSAGFDVLGNYDRCLKACDRLSRPEVQSNIRNLCRYYDHVVIDTPPVLAFPDALLWARIADATILASFAGKTAADDLKEAYGRLHELNITVLGTVLNGVHTAHSYNKYGYRYYKASSSPADKNGPTRNRPLLLTSGN
ncbi:Tyrosine-protein kinase YwqD [Anaerohalosphaera lusitana]|uniref:Tyrosine-protein kinase YwqD n=1 Tax=Anaerohalosphaera lusitana TaxID=1936003 RepID=A0A1U9NNE1_9BACT|nr:polysaccharide biosynthesis tyrosine autokinase [Anaerohalosphaera lusitana]AQT69462.1 Tyrosine-protein kinase YwqD [Anaerohalosphaera lusitana]